MPRPLDDIERALLARVGMTRTDRTDARVLADLWLEGRDEARGELVHLMTEEHDPSELLAAHGERLVQVAIAAGYPPGELELSNGFLRAALVIEPGDALESDPDAFRLSPRMYRSGARLDGGRRALHEATALTTAGRHGRYVLKSAHPGEAETLSIESDAAILGRLDHPHCMQLFDLALRRDGPAIVLPHRGRSLVSLLRNHPQPEAIAIAIGVQLCDALAHLAERGVIHREINRSHVLVADDGHVTLAGFGLATAPSIPRRRSEATGRLRSIDFRALSPEAAFGRAMSPAADLYGLGMLLATIVRGRHPVVEANSDYQIVEAIRAGRLELPEGTPLADLIRRTVVVDPQLRPSIAEFRAALGPADRAALVQLVR